jgi:hypothetical protein
MADDDSKQKPWAAIAAAAAFAALATGHIFTLNALQAQSEAMMQMIDATQQSSRMETAGLRSRQQIVLAEVRAIRAEAGASHGAEGEVPVEADGEEPEAVEAEVEPEPAE